MRLVRTLAMAAVASTLIATAGFARDAPAADARAVGYAALLPGGTYGAVSAVADGPTYRSSSATGIRPAGGGRIGSVRVDVGATTSRGVGTAQGTVAIDGVTLLDGRVTIGSLRMSASTTAGGAAGLTEGSVSGLSVDGVAVAAGPGSRVEVAGIGALVFLEQVADGAGGVRANALRVEVADPQAARVIGQPFVVGHLDLTATAGRDPDDSDPRDPAPRPRVDRPRPSPASPAKPDPSGAPRPATPEVVPIATPPPLGLPRRAAPEVTIRSDGGYVFPVAGEVGFSDDYGAPRAGTGWHHGNDLFAPSGTPLLAVADGTLSKVGVNTLGGNRLWLTDDAGNSFYYAHLSAYAPAAVEGARVAAGQVIGFLGNTGQAITTPPHLHFEVHPGDGDSVNPYPYLVAWQRGSDIPRAFIQAAVSPSPAPAVGAVLVDGTPEIDTAPPADDGLATPAT